MPIASRLKGPAVALGGLYLALWAGSTAYLAAKGADWTFPLISLGIFGIALTGVAVLLTLGARPKPIPVRRPAPELAALLAFLAVYAIGFLGWGMGAVKDVFPPGREQELLVLAVKLLVHVVAPAAILVLLGAQLRPLFRTGVGKLWFWLPLVVLGLIILALLCVVSPALKQIGGLHASAATLAWAAPAAFVWYALEAGFCEEFLFRAVLQSRLAAFLRTEAGAVFIGSLLFAVAHAPGLFLRGTAETDGWSTDPVQVVAFTIATLSPIAILFGTLWARTRSLLLIVLLHAAVDILPNLAEFVRTWA